MADSAETEVNAEQRSLDRSLLGGLAWTGWGAISKAEIARRLKIGRTSVRRILS